MIIILGDSWGLGEWGRDESGHCLTGPGIAQYFSLQDPSRVINLSEGGSSNSLQLEYFKQFLIQFKPFKGDVIYWIVSDPLRCVDSFEEFCSESGTLEYLIQKKITDFISRVNDIVEQYDNINCVRLIGGLCDLNNIDVTEYKKIEMTVPSWCKLLASEYITSPYCTDRLAELGEAVKKYNPKLLEEWQQISTQTLVKRDSFDKLITQQGLSNDGYHPNRYGHKKLRDFLYPKFANKS